MKILVIEKSEVCRFMLDQCLASLGHVFHHSGSADEALQFFRSHPVDFVFIDLDFGRERTLDAIKALRAEHPHAWFPLVALSSEADDETFATAILSGVDALLAKPLSRHRILMQVIALERIYIGRQSLEAKKDLIAANLALLKLSMYDDITGLANRRYFDETLNKEIRLAKRNRRPLSLLMCEIGATAQPHHGENRETENRRLRAVAAAIACIPSRPTDFVCRYGGNSFAAILPNTDQEGAQHIAERIQHAVDAVIQETTLGQTHVPPTFRIGLATHEGHTQTMADLIHAASAKLTLSGVETA